MRDWRRADTAPKALQITRIKQASETRNRKLRFEPLESRHLLATMIDVLAAGKTGEENIALDISGVRVAEWEAVGGDYFAGAFETLTYVSDTPVSIEQIRVYFTNDGVTASGDAKNVRIDAVKLDGVLYQSEHPGVLSTGTFIPYVGYVPNYWETEYLHGNGYFQYGPAGSAIHIHAAGKTHEENIALEIDGVRVASFENVAGNFQQGKFKGYTFLSESIVTLDQIRVAFTNGSPAPGGDLRSVRIGAVKLDGEIYQSEDPNVLSTGTLIAGVGCEPGYWQSEFLNCSGYFAYGGNPNIGTLSLGDSSFSVNEDAGSIAVPIVRTGGSDGTVSLDVTTVNATAIAGQDNPQRLDTDFGEAAKLSDGFRTRRFARRYQTAHVNDVARRDAFALFSRAPASVLPKGIEIDLELRSLHENTTERTWAEHSADDLGTINGWSVRSRKC